MDQFAHDLLAQQSGATAAWIGGISLGIFVIVKIKKAFGAVWPFIKKLIAVVEDLFGAEARPGVAARPGLMARMQTSEEADVKITETLEHHSVTLLELQPNHGGSMKDVLNQALGELKAQGGRIDGLDQALKTHIDEQRLAATNAEASAVDAASAATHAARSAVNAASAVTKAEASAVDAARGVTNAEASAMDAARGVTRAEASAVDAARGVTRAEASAVDAAHAATDAATAATDAATAAVDAATAVVAASKDRADRAPVNVNVTGK